MDTPSGSSLLVPRLRLNRHSPQIHSATSLTPVAGPSHYSPDMNHHESEDEDAESTPRLSQSAIVPESSPRTSPVLPTDTPAARLRALLARVPNDSVTPRPSSSQLPPPISPSEPDSDFDPPNGTSDTPSVARESLRELFSRALREPGNTPQKARPRRNSIDASIVDASPRIERVQQERAKNKGKRRSMSDEEADHLSNRSDPSFRSTSAAATFDALRERLGMSSTLPPTPPPEQMVVDMSMPPADSSEDTATMLQQLNRQSVNTTNSPMQTLQMSGQLQAQSSA
ncbi:hypothetical protein B0H21DRAFT_693921 [Amylocystis lapponica]|nr:hypothetical protein B0H21DRAFT_693921 [Amylocystis lapponica]